METVKAGKISYHRNEELLSVVRQKSEEKFRQFIAALTATEQTELAGLLDVKS